MSRAFTAAVIVAAGIALGDFAFTFLICEPTRSWLDGPIGGFIGSYVAIRFA